MKTRATALYPFVPSGPDFEGALSFFQDIGFAKAWREGDYAGLRFGAAYFILQRINVPDWQSNQMITFEVDDLQAYWSELEAKDLPTRHVGVRLRPPTDF